MRIPVDKIFTYEEPLGPYVTPEKLHQPDNRKTFKSFYDDHNFLSRQNLKYNPNILLGRRGSGKTALLFHLRFNGGYTVSTNLESESIFNDVASEVSNIINNFQDGLPLVETVAKFWRKIILTSTISQFYQRHCNDRNIQHTAEIGIIHEFLKKSQLIGKRSTRTILNTLIKVANASFQRDFDFIGDFMDDMFENEFGFNDALEAVSELLAQNSARAIVLINSLEQFPIHQQSMREALSGLLFFVGEFDLEYRPIHITICLPAELHDDFADISDNPEKDFRKVLTLHWDPIELFQICGHRFSVFLGLHENAFTRRIDALPENPSREEVFHFWNQFFPEKITNRYGVVENSLSYVSRHTQLLPRHFLNIFNKISMLALAGRDEENRFSEDDIIKGVRLGEGVICEGVFSGFQQKYPLARDVCKLLLPKLPNMLDYNRLRSANKSYGKGIVKDTGELLDMLIRMGILGRYIDQTEIYDRCQFDYTYNGSLPYTPDDWFGVHPAFSGQYGNNLGKFDANEKPTRPIFPIEVFTGDRQGTGPLKT